MAEPCCGQPAFRRAWVPCWPFRALYCVCCAEVTLDCPLLIEFIWLLVFAPFWDGTIRLGESV